METSGDTSVSVIPGKALVGTAAGEAIVGKGDLERLQKSLAKEGLKARHTSEGPVGFRW